MIIEWTPITESDSIPPLGDELNARLNAYHGEVKHSSCSAWNLLYRVLLQYENQPPMVTFTATGKPYFVNGHLHFSISHSKGLCAAAISNFPVGVDIEQCRDNYNLHLIEKSLTSAEKSLFDGDFTRLWCRKEAVAKMTGEGINGYPVDIDTSLYLFREQKIEYRNQKYWIVAVEDRLEEVPQY